MSEYSFTKLFSSITKSTVWCEPHTTLRVWITMLADCDRQGCVHASIPGLANLARVTVAECEAAISTFLAPDPYSRTADYEGRRIEPISGGWRLLNYELYRDRRDDGVRREQNREAQKRHRDRQRASAKLLTGGEIQQESAQGRRQKTDFREERRQEQVHSRGSRLPSDWELPSEWKLWASAERPDLDIDAEAARFADHWHSQAGKDGIKLNWLCTWRNWIRRARAKVRRGRGALSGAAADFSSAKYEGTPSEELPPELRAGAT